MNNVNWPIDAAGCRSGHRQSPSFQPMELRRGKEGVPDRLVVYSLGNFISNMGREHTDGGGMVKVVLGRKGLRRYIVSAQYSLIYSSRYKNEQGKEDIRVVPAASWSGKNQNSSFSVDSALIKYVNNTRLFLKSNNKEVEEYIFMKKRLLLAYSWQSEDFNSTTTIKILSVIKMDSGSIFYYQTKR